VLAGYPVIQVEELSGYLQVRFQVPGEAQGGEQGGAGGLGQLGD